ncbi:FTR1 family protein [Cupriavidus sp. 2TAF22]|uniref:FTR1 family iron permease n=1 Tax=unclassified Cupriavidus TaxID=2640874 RepID=UPI003F8E097E
MRTTVKFCWIGALCWALLAGAATAQPVAPVADAKQLWQLLDYVAVDYHGAVANGAVVSDSEYREMLDFAEDAARQARALPDGAAKAKIAGIIEQLRAAIVRKADAAEVAGLAHQANALLVGAYAIPVSPAKPPELARGAALFAAQCAACHGAAGAGDGPLGARLEPPPIAFTDAGRARSRSLMALYQAITQGVKGTAMPAFATLPDEDRWALAFFAGGLSHSDAMRERGKALWKSDAAAREVFPDLGAMTGATEAEAARKLPEGSARDVMAYLRAHPEVINAGKPSGLALSRQRLQESVAALRAGERDNASRFALSAYLDGFEPIEPTVGARNKALLAEVEEAMLSYRSAISKGTQQEAEQGAQRLEQLFGRVERELEDTPASPTATFLGALTILLREGLEALLIVVGMVAVLKRADRRDALRYVHGGWMAALVAGALTWAAATYLVTISGASRELTEGVGSVFAALVLLSVGLWMHQKSSAGRWQAYLKEKLSSAMDRRSAWALFMLSFVAVYREVFETVLFYSALAANGSHAALLAGFLAAALVLVVVGWILLRTSARIPIGKFFSVTSILVGVLSVVLIGKGAVALQEAGWIGATPIDGPRLDILGLFPTVQTLGAQLAVLAIVLLGFGFNVMTARKSGAK